MSFACLNNLHSSILFTSGKAEIVSKQQRETQTSIIIYTILVHISYT